jgi:hypothetical protein
MEKDVWLYADGTEDTSKTPYDYLFDYSSKLEKFTNGDIIGVVSECSPEREKEVIYGFTLVATALNNYSYKLFEVVQKDAFSPFPVTMRLFRVDTEAPEEKNNVSEQDFEQELIKFIQHSSTRRALTALKTLIGKKRRYEV